MVTSGWPSFMLSQIQVAHISSSVSGGEKTSTDFMCGEGSFFRWCYHSSGWIATACVSARIASWPAFPVFLEIMGVVLPNEVPGGEYFLWKTKGDCWKWNETRLTKKLATKETLSDYCTTWKLHILNDVLRLGGVVFRDEKDGGITAVYSTWRPVGGDGSQSAYSKVGYNGIV